MERLRFDIAHNSGLRVLQGAGGSFTPAGEFFAGRTLEHGGVLISRDRGATCGPSVVTGWVAAE